MRTIRSVLVSCVLFLGALALPLTPARAQKALVYCPVGIDAAGCNAAASALAADTVAFPGGADEGYDGSSGTVDLVTADLGGYAVLVIPSLADGAGATPYAFLRNASVAGRLKAAFVGRAAVWSGTPDRGSLNRGAKDNLIRGLARWARADSAGTHGPGVIALGDLSDELGARYDWLAGVSAAAVAADTAFASYDNAQVLTGTGRAILTGPNGLQIGYQGMAAYGLLPGDGTGADATGGRGAQVVLATAAGEPAADGIATVRTDREDYVPGDTVVVTGSGWTPGETVAMRLHEDPLVHGDRTLSAVADSAGHIYNSAFSPEIHDVGVRFVLTAAGQTSGLTAQATFTDAGTKIVTAKTAVTPVAATLTAAVYPAGNGTCSGAGTSLGSFALTAGTTTTVTSANGNNQSVKLTAPATAANPAGSRFLNWASPNGVFTYLSADSTQICIQGTNGNQTDLFTPIYATTSTSLTTPPGPSVFGESVTLTATVSSLIGGTVSAGTVTFKEGATTLGSSSVNTSGVATLAVSTLAVGTHSIVASYGGSGNFTPSTSGAASQKVNQASTTTALASSANPSAFGQSVTFTATVTAVAPGAGTRTGTVQFQIDGTNFGAPVALSAAGVATSGTISTLAAGAHPVAAVYGGDGNFKGSTSTVIATQTVSQAATVVSVAAAPSASVFGQPVTFTATVSSGVGAVTAGNVRFIEGGTCAAPGTVLQATSAVGSGGQATFVAGALATGSHTITACFDGTVNFSAASGSSAHTVGKAATATTITADAPDPSTPGQAVSVSFTVNAVAPGAGTPTGSVTVSDGIASCTAAVAAGGCSVSLSTSGPRTLTATYGGDANFTGSAGTTAHTVNVPSTSLAVSAATGTYGGTTSLSATLTTGGSPMAGKPVSFTLNGTAAGSATTDVSGTATLTAASLAGINAGAYPTGVGASFAGEAALGASSGMAALTVSPKAVTPGVTANGKTYDATTAAVIATRTLAGAVGADDVALTGGTATFDSKDVGAGKTVTVTGLALGGAAAGNYALSSTTATTTADITPKGLAPAITVSSKVYDGTTAATILTRTVTGVVGGEAVSLTGGDATFGDKHVGTGKTVTGAGFTLTGADAGNYLLDPASATTTADITPATVTGQFTADSKQYDGTTAATIATRTMGGALGGDVVTLAGGTATFATKTVGTGKTVTGTGFTLGGTDGGDYVLASTTLTATADITAATATGQIAVGDKVYDGTTAAVITARTLAGVLSGESVALTGGSASFDTKGVGSGKAVSGTGFTLTGADAENYVLASATLTTTAAITPATVTGQVTVSDKVYDGTTAATIATRALAGVLGTDGVTLAGGTAAFADKHAGAAKTVAVSGLTLSGADAGNYLLASTSLTASAAITARPLAVSASAENKVYDGTTTAAATLSDDRVAGDALAVSHGAATFDTRNAGTGKTVTVGGLALSGDDAGDYTLVATSVAATADITPAPVAPHITAGNKVYDGTADATIATRSLTGVLGSDLVSLTGGAATFANKQVGAGKPVTGTGFALAGADAGNYELHPTAATATADITPRTLTVTATAQDKVYDATPAAVVTLADDRIGGDDLIVGHAGASFATKHVGAGKAVTVSGIGITGGADAGNYELGNGTATTTASITPAPVVPVIAAQDKVYDGTTAAVIATRALTGVLGSDDVGLSGGTASFADKHVGSAKPVNGGDFTLAGADAGNYELVPATAATSASITPRPLAVTATGADKVYDATTLATVTLADDRVDGDLLTTSYAQAAFADKHVGAGKPVSVTGISVGGADAGNYQLSGTTAATTASITPLALVAQVTADDKVYDGTTDATILTRTLVGVLGSDQVSLTGGSGSFADKNAGAGKAVTVTGLTLAGADAGNYSIAGTAATTADVTRRPLAVTANPQTKMYGDPDPALTYAITGGSLVAGEGFTGLLTRPGGETVAGSPYAIAQGTLSAGPNYDLGFTGAALTVTKAPLTVAAANASKVYGNSVPAPLTGSVTGLKFSDQITATYAAYVATGGLAVVTSTTPVGGSPYPIIPSVSDPDGKLPNYALTLVNGALTITKATPVFSGVVIPNVVFGQGSSTVSGVLGFAGTGATVYPAGAVSVSVNGQSGSGTIQPNGAFTATVNTSALPANGTTGLAVSLSYNGSDPNFNAASGAGVMKVLYNTAAGHQFLQPINPNLTTGNRSSFKIGSTIPTKFELFRADGTTPVTTATATISVAKLDSNAETPVNEELITTPADNGVNFRLSGTQYIYNLGTKAWTAGTYRITATLDDGSKITADVDGRTK